MMGLIGKLRRFDSGLPASPEGVKVMRSDRNAWRFCLAGDGPACPGPDGRGGAGQADCSGVGV